jgi:hypothetical protein
MKKITLKTAIMKQLKTNIITAITAVFYFLPSFGGQGTYAQVPGTPYIVPTYYAENICTGLTTQGRDFWVTFGPNYVANYPDVFIALNIAANQDTDVTLTFTETGQVAQYHITGDTVHQIDLSKVQGNVPPNNTNLGDMRNMVYTRFVPNIAINGVTNNKSLHIESTMPVSIYAFNTGDNSTDATLLMPTQTWGTDYYRLSYRPYQSTRDVELIIAKEDGTELFLDGAPTPFAIIDAGQVRHLYSETNIDGDGIDFSGRHITSGKPVAYFTHLQLAQVPAGDPGMPAADILLEQLAPVNQWGTKFLVPNIPQVVAFYENPSNILVDELNHIRIIASEDDTTVSYTGASLRTTGYDNPLTPFDVPENIPGDTPILSGQTLDRGQWVELEIDGDRATDNISSCYITTDKPVGVTAYTVGGGGGEAHIVTGDPSISRIPSLEQSAPNILIAPFMFQPGVNNLNTVLDGLDDDNNPLSVKHHVVIIAPTASKGNVSMTSGGLPVVLDPNQWVDNIASTEGGTQPGFSYYIHTFDNVNDYGKSFRIANSDEDAGVIVLAAGIGSYESYYYNAGSGACVIN